MVILADLRQTKVYVIFRLQLYMHTLSNEWLGGVKWYLVCGGQRWQGVTYHLPAAKQTHNLPWEAVMWRVRAVKSLLDCVTSSHQQPEDSILTVSSILTCHLISILKCHLISILTCPLISILTVSSVLTCHLISILTCPLISILTVYTPDLSP